MTISLFLFVARSFAGDVASDIAGGVAGDIAGRVYYLDSRWGSDANSGLTAAKPWKSFAPLQRVRLHPGDSVRFRRGSLFSGRLVIADSGTRGKHIVLTDYGPASAPAPMFTNPIFTDGTYGNCIRLGGSWVIVEQLAFSGTAAYSPVEYKGDGWVEWEMGAIHIDRQAEHCIIRNNEIRDCVAGIRSNGAYALIEHNYIHDCNRVLKEWNWGPLGIWLGADHQEVCYNRIIDYSAVDPRIGWGPNAYGSGADGGALEIDDARYDKTDISIHDNETRDNQGFLEVTWTDVKKNPDYRNFHIYRNTSDDYQQFVALWRGAGCVIEDNTIVRRKVNANEWGVFNITQNRSYNIVRGNTVLTGAGVVVFTFGRKGTAQPETIISNNQYYTDSTRRKFALARDGKALMGIKVGRDVSATGVFAAAELKRYLSKMSGATFTSAHPGILLTRADSLSTEEYRIELRGKNLVLSGGSDRALLYAVYDLLHRLGCIWAAPESEYIPSTKTLNYDATVPIHEQPAITYRKLDVEEGRSHTIDNLRRIIAWMPKVRLNVLQVPLNYQGAGRVQWDHWRAALTPELKKRGLLIEVGGHGYQNFISARMEGGARANGGAQTDKGAQTGKGTLFRQHPDWFGCNRSGVPDSTENLVFNTGNPEAVHYFLGNVERYLRGHPEIDIFDCWPPDVAKWAECPAMTALGTAVDRQTRLMNQVDSVARRIRPGLKVEIIAYGQVLEPSQNVELNDDILVDVCPINQSFERPIYDTTVKANAGYFRAMKEWQQRYTGDLGIYSYYRKYAWRSLPVMLPHYMQRELRWYTAMGFRGISTYAEPGDWYTYGLNHYVLAGLAWDTGKKVDSLMDEFLRSQYGEARGTASEAYRVLEEVVRKYASIPYTRPKSAGQLDSALVVLRKCKAEIASAKSKHVDDMVAADLARLGFILDYAIGDLEIQALRAANAPVEARVKELVELLEAHDGEGLFVLHGKDNLRIFLNHYNSEK
ncbi:MAG TPA: DUF4838 domain-containing protein [Puia sp.]